MVVISRNLWIEYFLFEQELNHGHARPISKARRRLLNDRKRLYKDMVLNEAITQSCELFFPLYCNHEALHLYLLPLLFILPSYLLCN